MWYVTEVVGSGTNEDPYRSAVADLVESHHAAADEIVALLEKEVA